MSRITPAALGDERLVAELYRLGVTHLARFEIGAAQDPLPPPDFIAALAAHPQARLQGALVLLFLRQPEYAGSVADALPLLRGEPALTLQCYYQAAVYLQRELFPDLQARMGPLTLLPDLFSQAFDLPSADSILPGPGTAQAALDTLGEWHGRAVGQRLNWSGAYRQHLRLFFKHLEPFHA